MRGFAPYLLGPISFALAHVACDTEVKPSPQPPTADPTSKPGPRPDSAELAKALRGIRGTPTGSVYPPGAEQVVASACDAGDAEACFVIGTMFEAPRDRRKPNLKEAHRRYAQQCQAEPKSCFWLGQIYQHGTGVERNPAAAGRHFVRSCDAGAAEGCFEVADCLLEGKCGLKHDPAKGERMLSQLCRDMALGHACSRLALEYSSKKRGADFASAAAELWQRACDLGDHFGCHGLALAYRDGFGVARDQGRAVAIANRECNAGGRVAACAIVGAAYTYGQGVSADLGEAIPLLERACAGPRNAPFFATASACFDLAGILIRRGGASNATLAKNYLTRSCNLGFAAACDKLGEPARAD